MNHDRNSSSPYYSHILATPFLLFASNEPDLVCLAPFQDVSDLSIL